MEKDIKSTDLKEIIEHISVLLNKGKKVQIEYNKKNQTIYIGEVSTKKIKI